MTSTTNHRNHHNKKSSKASRPNKAAIAHPDTYNTKVPPSLDQKVYICSKIGWFEHCYDRGPQLGLGAFAHVFTGIHKTTRAEYAIKKIERSKMVWGDRDALEDEINNLISVREGPNIVQLYEVYEEQKHCYLVMELMRGGELFDVILDKQTFSESEARDCTRCLLRGLHYMHAKRVAHRDLKPENLLLIEKGDDTTVKLADFGFAKKVKMHNGCRTLCGTPGYLAPEILERWPAYDTVCDLWSVGVILFLLLGGYLPFEDEDDDKVFERTRNGAYDFHPAYWADVSKGAKNLVTKFLTVNPKKRYTAEAALQDDWFTKTGQHLEKKELNIEKLKASVISGKKKMKAAINTLMAVNRLENLKDNFNGYLERKNAVSMSRINALEGVTLAPRQPVRKFEEDSKTGRPFEDFYTLGDMLGEGGYACVFRTVHKRTGQVYAVKDVNTGVLENSSKSTLKDEIAALKLLRNGPFIIRLFDVFEEPEHTFMIMEEMKGGDLLERVTEKEVYTEREARKTCKILFQAMDYIHKMKIAHRDIKPENVLMVEKNDDTSIKLADFGFAKRVPRPCCLRTLCGTAQYVAPEVLDLQSPGYDHRADMWSVGVVIYILLGGYAPFEGPVHELARVITKGDYCFHDKYWCDISDAAKDLISSLLQINPSIRLSAEEALQSPWMTVEEGSLAIKDLSGAKENLQKRKETEPLHGSVPQMTNKYESLDVSFISDMGTLEEVAARKAQRTNVVMRSVSEDEEELIEDSTSGKQFEALYQEGRLIGEGNFSKVYECRHKQSKEKYAVKRIQRTDLHPSDAVALQDEISTLQMVSSCPYIVTLEDVFEEPDYTYMVMERLTGGELIERIIERRHYTENDARIVAKKVLMGLEHCHNRRIANRNIKTENLILTDDGTDVDVKISDFGFAKRVLYPNSLMTQCGTEGYVAPEILEHHPAYDVQCDMWSVGVVLYMLLGGYRPFRGEPDDIMRCIRYGEYKFHKRYWSNISEDAKILISRMLTVNPIGRITVTAALQSDWINMDEEELDEHVLDDNFEELRRNAKTKVKAAVNSVIATKKLQSLGQDYAAFKGF